VERRFSRPNYPQWAACLRDHKLLKPDQRSQPGPARCWANATSGKLKKKKKVPALALGRMEAGGALRTDDVGCHQPPPPPPQRNYDHSWVNRPGAAPPPPPLKSSPHDSTTLHLLSDEPFDPVYLVCKSSTVIFTVCRLPTIEFGAGAPPPLLTASNFICAE